MKKFKTFFEDNETALVPQAGEPLSSFLQRFEGETIKQIIDKSTYINLYFGNKYGLGGASGGKDKAIQNFSDSLVRFVNRNEKGQGPDSFRPRVYETEEFQAKHNYAEYQKLDVAYRQAFRKKFEARKAEDQEAFAAAEKEMSELGNAKSNSEFGKAERKARDDEDEYVHTLHNTPLSMNQLSDDGSEEYKDLELTYDRILDYASYND